MKDELISFETAKLAKEKGFNLYCINFYKKEKKNSPDYLTTGIDYNSNRDIEWDWNLLGGPSGNLVKIYPYPNNPKGEVYSAPTQSLLQRWLRESHSIEVIVKSWKFEEKIIYLYSAQEITKSSTYRFEKGRSTYEEALETGLVEGLKLIK
jgi:hypothetical protein